MRRSTLCVLTIMVLSSLKISACDICGCGPNNFYIGILPQFNHKFFGIRYRFNSFNTRLTSDETQFSNDFYQTVEAWGGWNVNKRFQVLAFVPVNLNSQRSDDGINKLRGLGDITLMANVRVLDFTSVNGNNKICSQQLWIGGGIKLATGKFKIEDNDPEIAAVANRQLGSGSNDFLLNAMYNVRINKVGINSTVNYKMNSANKDQFKFGDKISASSFVFYPLVVSTKIISPNLGLLYEHTKASEFRASKVDLTGGSLLQAAAGVEVTVNKVTCGFNVQLPIEQNFAENQTKAKVKGMAHVSFAL